MRNVADVTYRYSENDWSCMYRTPLVSFYIIMYIYLIGYLEIKINTI